MTCLCGEYDHDRFNETISQELQAEITAANVFNESFCVSIDLNVDQYFNCASLNTTEILAELSKKMGVYQLWVDQDYCPDHYSHKMLCVYTGKGFVQQRVKEHISKKWVKDEILYLTFFECENRIAKYLEQLSLDIYNFHLNSEENYGLEYLSTIWNEERIEHGTQFQEHLELLQLKYPNRFTPEDG